MARKQVWSTRADLRLRLAYINASVGATIAAAAPMWRWLASTASLLDTFQRKVYLTISRLAKEELSLEEYHIARAARFTDILKHHPCTLWSLTASVKAAASLRHLVRSRWTASPAATFALSRLACAFSPQLARPRRHQWFPCRLPTPPRAQY